MYPILLEIGRFKFYTFGSFIALATLVAGFFIFYLAKRRKLRTHHFFDTVLFTLLFALLGARVGYYFIYQNQFQSLWQIFLFWQGGLLALGGLITGFLTFLYLIKKEKDPIWQLLDIGALGLLVGWSIGKFGCFLSGCTLGRPTETLLGINGSYPVDLFSAIWALLLLVVMVLAWQRRKLSDGVVFFLSMEGFFLGELLINTLKADFGENIVRTEAVVHLTLIIAIYLIFWRLHGPRFEQRRLGLSIKNFVFKRRHS